MWVSNFSGFERNNARDSGGAIAVLTGTLMFSNDTKLNRNLAPIGPDFSYPISALNLVRKDISLLKKEIFVKNVVYEALEITSGQMVNFTFNMTDKINQPVFLLKQV